MRKLKRFRFSNILWNYKLWFFFGFFNVGFRFFNFFFFNDYFFNNLLRLLLYNGFCLLIIIFFWN